MSEKQRANEWGVKKFEKWCEEIKIAVDLKTVDLNEVLRKFFVEVKTKKGQSQQALPPNALTGIILTAIHRQPVLYLS